MSICTDVYRPVVLRPRRIRAAECSAYEGEPRWVNLIGAFDLTPDPTDNEPGTIPPAWSLWDTPVTYCAQDVDARGNDLILVAIANRVYWLDWEAYQDQWNWESVGPIYRRLTLGPLPANAEDVGKNGSYDLAQLKRFRRLTFQLATPPADDPVQSQYQVSVVDAQNPDDTAAVGIRRTQQNADVRIAHRGYAFNVTLEHDANEDFPLLWWQGEYESMGDRRKADDIVTS